MVCEWCVGCAAASVCHHASSSLSTKATLTSLMTSSRLLARYCVFMAEHVITSRVRVVGCVYFVDAGNK